MQESKYRHGDMHCKSGAKKPEFTEIVESCYDFGVTMINTRHTTLNPKSKHQFEIPRLLNDLDYAIEAGAIVLSWFHKRYAHKEEFWWVRYNCGTNPSINRATCNDYKSKVVPYL